MSPSSMAGAHENPFLHERVRKCNVATKISIEVYGIEYINYTWNLPSQLMECIGGGSFG